MLSFYFETLLPSINALLSCSINFHISTPSHQSLSHIFWPQGKTLIFTTEYQLPTGNVENVLKIF